MNYVRSLWILHCREWCPICPLFPDLDETATGMLSLLHNTAEINQFSSLSGRQCCWERHSASDTVVSEPNAVGDIGRSVFAEWTRITLHRFLRITQRKPWGGLVFSFTINVSYSFIKGILYDLTRCHFRWSWKQSDLAPQWFFNRYHCWSRLKVDLCYANVG